MLGFLGIGLGFWQAGMACGGRCEHVIMVPTPFVGHCIPFFYLASRLAHLGVRVTFLVAEGLVPQFYSHSLFTPHVGLIQREGVEVVRVKDGFSHLGFLAGVMPFFKPESSEPVFVASFGESVAALMARTDRPAPCCIVSDMLQGWTQTVAEQFNIPRFVLHTQSATNLSLMLLVLPSHMPLLFHMLPSPFNFKMSLPNAASLSFQFQNASFNEHTRNDRCQRLFGIICEPNVGPNVCECR